MQKLDVLHAKRIGASFDPRLVPIIGQERFIDIQCMQEGVVVAR